MEKFKQIKGVKTLIDLRENTMLHIIANNKNLSVSPLKAYEPIINDWLSEINKLNMKILTRAVKYPIQKKVV